MIKQIEVATTSTEYAVSCIHLRVKIQRLELKPSK